MRYNFNWPVIWRNAHRLYGGILLGLAIAVVSLAIGCVIGILLAVCRQSRNPLLRLPATAFVELVRNTPLLLLVFFIYFGLPELGVTAFDNIETFTATLAIYAGAYLTNSLLVASSIRMSPSSASTERGAFLSSDFLSDPFFSFIPNFSIFPFFLSFDFNYYSLSTLHLLSPPVPRLMPWPSS